MKTENVLLTIKCIFILFCLWYGIGVTVFALRHPWATDTERLLHPHAVLTFEKVPYGTWRYTP